MIPGAGDLMLFSGAAAAAPPLTYATWNPADKSPDIALTNGNLTITKSVSSWVSARATVGKSSGKWYWEATITGSNGSSFVGVARAAMPLDNWISPEANGWSMYDAGGTSGLRVHNGSFITYGVSNWVGKTIGIALDMDAGTLAFYSDGASLGVAHTGITGTVYPAGSRFHAGDTMAANFGATPFAYPAPSGFNSGVYL